jgi:FdrA protein
VKAGNMITGIAIRRNQYYDSVFLMGFSNRLSKIAGVNQVAVLMGSTANQSVLINLGYSKSEIATATPNDLVVAINAESPKVVDEILLHLDEWLSQVNDGVHTPSEIHTLDQAFREKPESNLVVISVPGEYAASEARKGLEAGKHVFLFSDNVSVEDEVSLKTLAKEKGLLVMGPDCGTSLIGGIGIGFANAVRKGRIGAIAAAGTGLQEFTCMVHNLGYGISHAIGTGGRDLSEAVGGLTTLLALDALEDDPSTQVIAIISKPPAEKTLNRLTGRIKRCSKPIICCFIGIDHLIEGEGKYFHRTDTIDEAAILAVKALGGNVVSNSSQIKAKTEKKIALHQRYLRGVFAGGTFCYQSQQILKKAGINVYSNGPLDKKLLLHDPEESIENSIVDMGDEYFMVGRPHPMINGSQRAKRILKEANDPEVGILLLDFILGYNSSPDPVGELIESIEKAKQISTQRGNPIEVVASICGTDGDFQDINQQMKMLTESGVKVFSSNAQATEYCVSWLRQVNNG